MKQNGAIITLLTVTLLILTGCAAMEKCWVVSRPSQLAGTIWKVQESDGDEYEFRFQKGGTLHYSSVTGEWTNGTWRKDGNNVYIEMNDRYAERRGTIDSGKMKGKGWNKKGLKWAWKAQKQ